MNFRREATSRRGRRGPVSPDPRALPGCADDPADGVDAPGNRGRAREGRRRRLHRKALGRLLGCSPAVRNLLDLRSRRPKRETLQGTARGSRGAVAAQFDLCGIVYESEAMHTLVSTGHAGRTRGCAGAYHRTERRRQGSAGGYRAGELPVRTKPYLKVNFGALPNELIEAELFGTDAGAFTGATRAHRPLRSGRGGTLFLDEIGNLPGSGQAKLLRVLQTGEFERLGSNTHAANTCARHCARPTATCGQRSARASFREDLFYRLNVIELEIPALAERREDILPPGAPLPRAWLRARAGCRAMRCARHPWPGNVRELQNTIRRACLLSANETSSERRPWIFRPLPPRPAAEEATRIAARSSRRWRVRGG